MKTQTLFLVFAIVAMIGVASAQTYDQALSLVNVTVSPNPVVAGGNATIRFQLYNSYNLWLTGVTLQPTGSYPLLNVSPLNAYVIGTVYSNLNPKYYNYTIEIPNTTPSGVYTITFTARYLAYAAAGTEIDTSTMPLSFYVQNRPAIKVLASSPQPSTLYAGYNQTLNLLIENTGYGTARNVSVTVSSGHGLNVLSSVTTFFISNLTQGSTVSEPLLVSAQSVGQPYLLANISYYSSKFQQYYSSTQRINLSVAPSAQFTITSGGSNPPIGEADAPIHFVITNTGTSPADELQLNLQTAYPITPVASTAYVNELQPGASANVTFLVSIDTKGVPGNYPVTLYEQWKQPSGSANQQFTGSDNYYIAVGGTSSKTGSLITDAVVAIVVIVAVVLVYRRFVAKGRKKEKK